MSEINPSALKVVDLRSELSNRNLPVKGKKDELIARLTEALELEKQSKIETQATDEKPVETAQDQTEKDQQTPKQEIEESKDTVQASIETVKKSTPVESTNEEITEEKTVNQPIEEKTIKQPVEEKMTEQQVEPVNEEVAEETPIEKPVETLNELVAKEKTDIESKEQAGEAPGHQETTKEEMDTDAETGVKRKRMDAVENEEAEKRIKLDAKNANDGATSSAICVKGFVRPLIIRHVQELFSKYGKSKRFWMDSIKTHCYVIYENDTEANEAFKNVHGIKFPEDTGKLLTVESLTEAQVESLIEYEQNAADRRVKVDWEASIERVKSGLSLPSSSGTEGARKIRSIGIGQVARQLAQAVEPTNGSSSREVRVERPQKHKDLSLDELFRKTAVLPHLYYLPNTDEEAKAKLQKLHNA